MLGDLFIKDEVYFFTGAGESGHQEEDGLSVKNNKKDLFKFGTTFTYP
jgi:hypothetical protein